MAFDEAALRKDKYRGPRPEMMPHRSGDNGEVDAIQRMLDQQRLDEIVSPSGCPIAVLPLLNLALVCRCLNSADLLSVYKSSLLMQAAAVHPLTFQHGNRFTVDPWRQGVRTEGPIAHCRSVSALHSALLSRRFSSFRLLSLETNSSSLQWLVDSPSAPVLHALSVRIGRPTLNVDLSVMFRPEARIADAPAFAYLRVLSITCGSLMELEHSDAALPPRLELLQLQPERPCATWLKEQQMHQVPVLLPVQLGSLLAPLTQLRQLVVRDATFNAPPPKSSEPPLAMPLTMTWNDVLTLQSIEAAAPQIDSIVWMIEVDYNAIASAMGEFSKQHPDAPWPKLRRVHTLQIKRVAVHTESELAPNPLLLFPSLTELRYTHQATSQASAGRYQGLMLNQLCAAQLTGLTHLTLTEAGPSPFNRTGWTVPHGFDLAPLLRTLPHLTFLCVPRLRIDSLSVFRFAPKLRTLHDLFWPVPYGLVKAEEMAECFPSLTELSARALGLVDAPDGLSNRAIYSPLSSSLLRPVLCAMPQLQRVSINTAPVTRPADVLSGGFDAALQSQRPDRDSPFQFRSLHSRHCLPLPADESDSPSPPSADDDAAALLAAFAGVDIGATGTQATTSVMVKPEPEPPATRLPAVPAPLSFSFGDGPNPFGTPFSFAPAAPGGPAFAAAAAQPTPLSFARGTSAAAASSAAPAFSFTPASSTPALSSAPAWCAAPLFAGCVPASAFSAAPSAFAAAAPTAAANPFSTPFVFNAAPASSFTATAPVGLPDLAGFNPFAAASASSSAAQSASAGSNKPSSL